MMNADIPGLSDIDDYIFNRDRWTQETSRQQELLERLSSVSTSNRGTFNTHYTPEIFSEIQQHNTRIQGLVRSMTIDQLVELAERFPVEYRVDSSHYLASSLLDLDSIRERIGNHYVIRSVN